MTFVEENVGAELSFVCTWRLLCASLVPRPSPRWDETRLSCMCAYSVQ